MTADGSMAVWCEHKAGAAGAASEVHFNYWRIRGDKSFTDETPAAMDFVEVGILLRNASLVERAFIYLPGPSTTWQIEDCGPRFRDPNIAEGIFNKELTSAYSAHPEHIELLLPDRSPLCRVHIFPTVQGSPDPAQLLQADTADGTLLTVTRAALDDVCHNLGDVTPTYFRIRGYVRSDQPNPFIKSIVPRDRHLQTGYSIVDYLDFRLNESRSLPRPLETQMRQTPGTRVALKHVAFLTAVPVQSDITTISWDNVHKKRLLEKDLWSTYVPTGIPKGMMVYHWRELATRPLEDPTIEDFSGFVKMQTRVATWRIAATSLLIAFFAGVAGNLFASFLWDNFHNTCACQKPTANVQEHPNAPAGPKSPAATQVPATKVEEQSILPAAQIPAATAKPNTGQ